MLVNAGILINPINIEDSLIKRISMCPLCIHRSYTQKIISALLIIRTCVIGKEYLVLSFTLVNKVNYYRLIYIFIWR